MIISFLFGLIFLFQATTSTTDRDLINIDGQNFTRYSFTGNINFSVDEITISENGLLWAGTIDGVYSFDGYEAESYQESLLDTAGKYFQGDRVSSILIDSQNNIWAGTYDRSLNMKPSGEKDFYNLSRKLDGLNLNMVSLIESQDGFIWAASTNELLRLSYESGKNKLEYKYRDFGDPNEMRFWSLFESRTGEMYVLGNGLFEVDYSESGGIVLNEMASGNNFRYLLENNDGSYLLGIENDLYHWKRGESPKLIKENLSGNRWINKLFRDRNGYIWASSGTGIYRLSIGTDYLIKHIRHFNTGSTKGIHEDESGNLFFGSYYGLLKLSWDYEQYSYIKLPDEYKDLYSYKYFSDVEGNYWIGTLENLLVYDKSTNKTTVVQGTSQIYSIIEDKNYNVWTGSRKGIRKYDPENRKLLFENNIGFTHNLVNNKNGTIWGLNNNRLFKLNKGTNELTYFDSFSGSGTDRFNKILIDQNGVMWAFRTNWEFNKLDISTGNPILQNSYKINEARYQINWMTDDQLGNIWLSTKKGVLVFNKEEGKVTRLLNSENTFPDNDTYEMIQDESGTIWVKQANYGSTAINPETMETVTFTPTWLTRPNDNGYYCVNSIGRNGELFTDGRGGFFVFHPDSISINENPPKVVLKEVLVNNVSGEVGWLKHHENDIEFKYTGIHFDEPDRNNFAYFLDGFEDSWNYVRDERVARYLSLPPGDYTFYAKASNSEGIWSNEVELATFSILPPWWKTSVAYFFYLLLTVGIGFAIYRTQLNKRLAEAETARLQELDEFKTRFFTNISHEFRTPLTVISGLANRISDNTGITIRRNAQKLLSLINQILELSKLESDSVKLTLYQADILSYTNYLVQSFSSYAEENGISLNVESDYDELIVDFDKEKYDLIIQNLISNAIKFTPEGGTIDLFMTKESRNLLISVKDTGVGIENDQLNRIFDRFYQVETIYSNHQGSGIGLSLTRELVQLMKGSINVKSIPGKGTTFNISIPVSQDAPMVDIDELESSYQPVIEQSHKPEEKTDLISTGRNRVLLVEDNEDVREFVNSVISKEFDVVTAVNGDEGLERAMDLIPDLIVSDVMMPGKDGIELTDILKNNQATSHIPIILLTAKADIESRLEGLKTGADVYLSKPFNESELVVHLQNLLAQRERIRAKYSEGLPEEQIEDEFILKIHNTIIEHLSEEQYGIEDICKEVGVSRTQLHRKLKALTGFSTSIFIRDIRLAEGKKLLKKTSLSVSEIAYQVGFSDPNYFSKLYSEKYSNSPSKER